MKAMVYTFKITYMDCENKIWRTAQVSSNFTLAKIGYLVLATFDTLAYHLFKISIGNQNYVLTEEDFEFDENAILLSDVKLSELNLSVGNHMSMIYDYGCDQEFDIELLSVEEMGRGCGTRYPLIIDGKGKGIIDDMSALELLECIHEIDKTGKSEYTYFSHYEKEELWDYRDFAVEYANLGLKYDIEDICYAYECGE